MALNIVDDVGAPALVTVVNIAGKKYTKPVMGQPLSDVLTYAMTAGGYVGAYLGWGGKYSTFVKNIAISAAPLAFEKIYNKISTPSTGTSRMANRVSRYPAPAAESPFQSVRLV